MTGGSEWTYDVRIRGIRRYKGQRGTTYTARWVVHGRQWQKTFPTAKLADGYRSDLLIVARNGEGFSIGTGLPQSMAPTSPTSTWLEHCIEFVEMKWPHISPNHRKSIAETLTGITMALAPKNASRPPDADLRRALYRYALNATAHTEGAPSEIARALTWLRAHSAPVTSLEDSQVLRTALDAIATSLNGKAAAASTVVRKRAVFHNCLEYAVERQHFTSNPLAKVRTRRMPAPTVVDRRVVVNPGQARAVLAAVRSNDPELEGFFACMYYAGLRPAEVRNLRLADCALPQDGWGTLLLSGSFQSLGPAWTDGGAPGEERELKHRARGDTRPVPAHPELVTMLHRHIADYPLGPDGRLFVNRTGTSGVPLRPPYPNPVSMSTVYRAWHRARAVAFSPQQLASPLARRPYDLRHACLSTWLNAGVPPVQVAQWAGHTVAVLLHIYAKCVDGQDEAAKRRIERALGGDRDPSPEVTARTKLPHVFPTTSRKSPATAKHGRTNRHTRNRTNPQVRGPSPAASRPDANDGNGPISG